MAPRKALSTIAGAREAALRLLDRLAFAPALATRVVVGFTFMHTGWGKLHNLSRTAEFFASLGIPFPAANAGLVSTLELVGGVLLIAGLGTRAFAAALSAS
ncbi:MAG TPA: DoxX family protein, partial [Thermoanaerobaculaceae bacterium]|nr:DoxX family protein [Thermoanaerobaculaceae bacterium]